MSALLTPLRYDLLSLFCPCVVSLPTHFPSPLKFFFNCSSLMSHLSFWSHQQFNPKWSSASLNSSLLNIAYHTFHCDFVMFCSNRKCLSFCYEWLLSMVINAHFIGDDGSSLSVDIGLKKFQ